jgi:hypothetical protein
MRRRQLRKTRMLRFASIAAMVTAVGMWTLPASARPGLFAPGDKPASAPGLTVSAMQTPMEAVGTGDAATSLTGQLAAARLATAKYATNLARAKADGYEIITPMMPDMGIHFLNPRVHGFNIRKPPILVYEHHGRQWQLGALEWIFTSMPKTPPLPNATFGFFPAACHYKDGTFIADENSKTCKKKNPKTGSAFNFWHPDLTTMHVWIWYPNPAGLYSSTNPLVAPFNGG